MAARLPQPTENGLTLVASNRISDSELIAAIAAAEQQALGATQGTVASDRADAIDRYLGKPYGDEVLGRSQVVSRDVSDVVEGVLANVLKPFVGGDEVVQFNARGPEDEDAAQQETDYVNFVVLERNNGFVVLNSAIKDALLLRIGYVTTGWAVRQDVMSESYQGLNDEEVAVLAQDEDVEIVGHTEYPDPSFHHPDFAMAGTTPPGASPSGPAAPMLHDVKLRRVHPTEFVEVEPVPPDEMRISTRVRTPSLQDADFVQRARHMSLSALREAGYKIPDDISDDDRGESLEEYARQRFGQRGDVWNDETTDPARRLVLYKESYLRIDRDGDGIAELRKVCQVGVNILADEEVDDIPFACFAGTLMPHQHLGISVYDLIKDIAQIKTTLLRQYLDNKYLANNPQKVVDANTVNIDDLLVSRPGGIIRRTGGDANSVIPLVVPDTGAGALEALEYMDSVRENRTGYTRHSQGLEADTLINKTASGLQMQLDQSQIRLELISRTIAETGLRDLFRLVHALTLKHSTKAEKVKLRNKWVMVNPREWVRRTDMSISVGLGTTTAQQMVQNLMLLGQAQEKAFPLGLVDSGNIYNTLKKMPGALGFKHAEEFFKAPQIDPQTGQPKMPPPQQDPSIQVAQIKAQSDGQIAQMKHQMEGQAQQTHAQVTQAAEQARTNADMQIQQHKVQSDYQLEVAKTKMQLELQAFQHNKEQETAVIIANIEAAAKIEVARITAKIAQGTAMAQAEMQAAQEPADAA